MRVKTYNFADVAALSRRIPTVVPGVSSPASGSCLASPKGRTIMRTTATRQFKLETGHMNRLIPVREAPNAHANAGGPLRYYNLCDVEALANQVAGTVPAQVTPSPGSNGLATVNNYNRGRRVYAGPRR
ncbi:hypothetical protein DFH07DRAFT_834142 [Mycena maculata]|uniref:Uncharacterized protein n=1 Tax=Mycena maculata TaxID=230809 RepID=A0AAD7IMS0_9AGAR|nr:hypothetical protein DFH07DRAFT_834142 [Mycena maculata]